MNQSLSDSRKARAYFVVFATFLCTGNFFVISKCVKTSLKKIMSLPIYKHISPPSRVINGAQLKRETERNREV